jgi:hypothetical protein
MTLLQWDWRQFAIKFLTTQGGAIIALIRAQDANPWHWADVLFAGLMLALAVDTSTWLVNSRKATKEAQKELK